MLRSCVLKTTGLGRRFVYRLLMGGVFTEVFFLFVDEFLIVGIVQRGINVFIREVCKGG